MPGLHIVLGGSTRTGAFTPVYVGASGSAARAAEATSPHEWHVRLDNPVTVIKHNPNAAANAAPVESVVGVSSAAEESSDPEGDSAATDTKGRGRRK